MELRIPMPADIKAAQRGLDMLGMSIADLEDEINFHRDNVNFASRVIVLAAKQMLAVKRRNGAEA